MMPNEVAIPHGFKINQLSYLLDWEGLKEEQNVTVDSFLQR